MLQLDHINIYVSDVIRSRDFYVKILEPFGYRLNRDYGEHAAGLRRTNYAELALVGITDAVQPDASGLPGGGASRCTQVS